ncbi:histidine kinase [bacterium]|nr:MAG: histidine kinase [bacterium]
MNLTSEHIEKELKRLKKIENYRKEFIGDVSHELKTPIFAIQGFIETLLDGAIEDETVNKEFLKKALRNVNRLIYLTNDLMEISKLEAGELKINFDEFNLATTVYEVVESLHFKAEQEKVLLSMDEVSDSIRIVADRNHFKQIMINLVENAIKYNKPGGEVHIGAKPYPQLPEKTLIYIRDTGLGIDKKFIKRVTERFFRVDKSRSREKGGTGLGLAIVKHTIEAHGESLFIESTPNVGSTFSFTMKNAQSFHH